MEEFHSHSKFGQRIHTLFIIQKTFQKVSKEFMNERQVQYLLKLADDPVPNIKFNVAKTIEMIYDKLSNSNKVKSKDALQKMVSNVNEDFDVKYYAERALKNMKF